MCFCDGLKEKQGSKLPFPWLEFGRIELEKREKYGRRLLTHSQVSRNLYKVAVDVDEGHRRCEDNMVEI
jgi:hypothetical protein